jgi:hypothetical protein
MKYLLLVNLDVKIKRVCAVVLNFRSRHSFKSILQYCVIGLTMSFYCACIPARPKDKPWSKAYEQHLYNGLDSIEKQRIPDDEERHAMISFVIDRYKKELPNGIESVSQDSFKTIATKIGLEYAHKTDTSSASDDKPTTYKWSEEVEQQLREGFMKGYKANGPEDAKQKCACFIARLKQVYPDSIKTPLSDQAMVSVLKPCF